MRAASILLVSLMIVGAVFYMFRKRKDVDESDGLVYTFKELENFSDNILQKAIAPSYKGRKSSEYEAEERQRNLIRASMRTCGLGDRLSKVYIRDYLKRNINKVYRFTDSTADKMINFSNSAKLTDRDRFDILLHYYRKQHRNNAFKKMVEEHKLDELQLLEVDPDEWGYFISKSDIVNVFDMVNPQLNLEDKIDIIIQRVYGDFLGRGPVDELLDQNVDGVSGGTSGLPADVAGMIDLELYEFDNNHVPTSFESVSVFFKGKTIRIESLSFGSEDELIRVCQNIYTYGNPGQFNQEEGHKIGELADRSRVVVVGPKFSDSWTFFVRKFDGSITKPKNLYGHITNFELFDTWMDLAMKGELVTIWSGQQGTGKTSGMKAYMGCIYRTFNIRVQEGSSFELWLRVAYPKRDLATFRETSKMTAVKGIVVQKKTDGSVNVLGEIAGDEEFSVFLKAAKIASRFSVASHHAPTAEDMINAARDALMLTGQFKDSLLAEIYAASVFNLDVHLENVRGTRFPERVTEFIPVITELDLSPEDRNSSTWEEALININKIQYEDVKYRHRKVYTTQNIIEYRDGAFIPANRPTDRTLSRMRKVLMPHDLVRLENFLEEYFPLQKEIA